MPAPTRRTARPGRVRPKRHYAHGLSRPASQTSKWRLPLNKITGVLLLVGAGVLVVTHQAEHAGVIDPLPGNLEDLLLGFPMAGVFFIAGFVAMIWRPQ